MGNTYQFAFEPHVSLEAAESTLQLAMYSVEGLVGRVRVRLDASYQVDPDRQSLFVDGETWIGRMIIRVFAGLLHREFGEDAFQLHRVASIPNHLHRERAIPA